MNIDNLLFQPWRGKHYGSESIFQIPILIVGESNYTKDPEKEKPHSEFTRQLIVREVGSISFLAISNEHLLKMLTLRN